MPFYLEKVRSAANRTPGDLASHKMRRGALAALPRPMRGRGLRNFNCPAYDLCLDGAVSRACDSFHCGLCPLRRVESSAYREEALCSKTGWEDIWDGSVVCTLSI